MLRAHVLYIKQLDSLREYLHVVYYDAFHSFTFTFKLLSENYLETHRRNIGLEAHRCNVVLSTNWNL